MNLKHQKEREREKRTVNDYPNAKGCLVPNCNLIHSAKGYCRIHYIRKDPTQKLTTDYNRIRQNAKKRKVQFDLTKEQWVDLIKKPCYYCLGVLGKPVEKSGIGLDRIDNDKSIGYITSNVVPCCKVCNCIRGQWLTVPETLAAVQAVIKHRQLQLERDLIK